MGALDSIPRELVWGAFPRLLGAVYLIAFASNLREVLFWSGSRGITPVREVLARIRADYPGWRRLLYFPTLLWLGASDRALRAVCGLGVAAALLVLWGGPLGQAGLLACWALYLSLDLPQQLSYPWESALLEAGFLALFLPETSPLPELRALALPAPALAWAYRLLLFRILFGFGKFKFLQQTRFDWDYLRSFLVGQPIPSPLGWWGHHLPRALHRLAVGLMFLVEVPVPFLVFASGWVRVGAGAAIAGLMAAIQLCGNFGFFNLVVAVLAWPLLDARASLFEAPFSAHPALNALVAVLATGALLNLPFNTWVARGWLYWPTLQGRVPAPLRTLLGLYRLLTPFRLVHAYGVFPPESGPPLRLVPVFEGTHDGRTWQRYAYQFMPWGAEAPPRFVAPHCPRLDHLVIYEALGVGSENLLGSFFNQGWPQTRTRFPKLERVAQRLLEGGSPVAAAFGHNPFPDAARPPVAVRVRLLLLEPTAPGVRAGGGPWWREEDLGVEFEARCDDARWAHWLPEPERFHPDELCWRRRSPALEPLRRAVAEGAPLRAAAADPAAGVSEADVARLWEELVPSLPAALQKDWAGLEGWVQETRARLGPETLHRMERVLGRTSHALCERMAPHFLGHAQPRIELPSYFHLVMLAHATIAEGEASASALYADPATAAARASALRPEAGLALPALFWLESLKLTARKTRLLLGLNGLAAPQPSPPGLPGFLYVQPWLVQQLPGAEVPRFARAPGGDWHRAPGLPAGRDLVYTAPSVD